MYRCITLKALTWGLDLDDNETMARIAEQCMIVFENEPGSPQAKAIYVDGVEVTTAIRTAEIDANVSKVSAIPAVRAALLVQQQRIGHEGDYIVEGRDIGTVVFPDAELKVFLTASDEERARRRVAQNIERGVGSTDFEEVLAAIIKRDEYDSGREIAPLKPAEDSVLVDSTDMTIDEVIDRICELAQERMA